MFAKQDMSANAESEFEDFVQKHKAECYDEDGEFNWDKYQYLCDIAEYWEMD